jgi:hypothetical protein
MGNTHLNVQKRNVTEKHIEIRRIAKKIPDGSLLPAICGEKAERFLANSFCKRFGKNLRYDLIRECDRGYGT